MTSEPVPFADPGGPRDGLPVTTPALEGITDTLPRWMMILSAWLSPAYPLGAFSHSHGIEWAVEAGVVTDAASLGDWLEDCLRQGGGWTDAVLLAQAHRAAGDGAAIRELADLARALAPGRERLLETCGPGAAFAKVTAAVWPVPGLDADPLPWPVALGRAAALHGMPPGPVLTLALQGFAANLVSAGVRLIPLGQTDGQRVLARLIPVCAERARAALAAGPEDFGGCTHLSDIAAMRHETQYTRLFRT